MKIRERERQRKREKGRENLCSYLMCVGGEISSKEKKKATKWNEEGKTELNRMKETETESVSVVNAQR